jgi:zinc protease
MKRLKFFSVLILTSCLFAAVNAQKTDLDSRIPPDPSITIGKLDNGLTYYIKHNTKPEQRIEFRLAINVGSVCETDGQQGLAHFMEHMCFNGTKNFPSNKIIDMLEEMGVKFGEEINAYTGFDQTIYVLKIPSDKEEWINRGFQVVEDWAHQVTLDASEIDKERGVIVEEWRLGLGAEDRMQQKYIPVVLKGSRYADRLPIGKIDIIKSFTYDTLRSFYSTWYRPDLMAVVIVGDIDPKIAEQKVKEYFGKIPKAVDPTVRIEYQIPDNTEPLISVVTDKEATDYSVMVFFKHPKADNGTFRDYREQVMQSLYTGMLNKRLQEIVRKPESPFLYAATGYGGFIGRSVDAYQLMVSAKENLIKESLETIMIENERVRRFGFLDSELEREKKDILTYYERLAKESDKTESNLYADEYTRNYLDQESIPGIQKEFELVSEFLPEITLDDINNMGKEWITDKNIVALVTAQEKEGVDIPDESDINSIIKSVKNITIEPYTENIQDSPLLKEIPEGTGVTERMTNQKFGYTEVVFGNGVKMVLKPTDFKNDQILISAFSPGGTSLYPDNDIMSAILASTIISQSGLGEYDYMGLQKKLSGNTARLTPYINELREGVNGNCSPKDLETMLQLNYLYFTEVRRDEEAFNAYISRMKNMIRPMRANPQVIFSDTLTKIISMNSPRTIGIPTESQLDQVNLDRIMAIYKDRFADASDFTYFMIGNFQVDEVIPLLEKYIGGLPSINRKETWKNVSPDFPSGHIAVDVPKNSEPQSLVAMVWKEDFKWKSKSRQAFSMLMDILSIKLRESMREEQGGVYGVSIGGSPVKYPEPRVTITSSWGCDPDSIDKLVQTVIDEMSGIIKKGPTDQDLNKIKETMIRERETNMKENNFWLSMLQAHYLSDDMLLSLEEYREFVNSFTIKDIKKVAGQYLDTENYVRVALTPMAEGESLK